jgi:predicted choloylglycine hydrolase
MDSAEFKKIVLEGPGRARGRAHGEMLRGLIGEHLERWLTALAADLRGDPRHYLRKFLFDTDFLPAIERWTPDLLEEVRGIAEASNQDFDLVLARQLSDEEPWYRREFKRSQPSHAGCTSLGACAQGERATIVAQNMDMPDFCEGLQVLLHIKDPASDVEVLEFSLAGKINLAGMNSAGLAMACNTLSQLDYSKTGLAEDFLVRGFLQRASLDEGLEFLRAVEHASGQNYTLAAPNRAPLNVEASACSLTLYEPAAPQGCVYHTNHPLTNEDQGLFRRATQGLAQSELERLYFGSSYTRFAALERSFSLLQRPPNIEEIKAILSSHDGPICRHGEDLVSRRDNFTVGCLIMELGDAPLLHVAPGPPCSTPFLTFGFDR